MTHQESAESNDKRSIYTPEEHETARSAMQRDFGFILRMGDTQKSLKRLTGAVQAMGNSWVICPNEDGEGIDCEILGLLNVEGEGDDAIYSRTTVGLCTVTDGDVLAGLNMALYRVMYGLPLYAQQAGTEVN